MMSRCQLIIKDLEVDFKGLLERVRCVSVSVCVCGGGILQCAHAFIRIQD